MSKRKHRSQAQWQNLIQQQIDSGLNAAEFCRQQGLSSKTFYKRRLTLSSEPTIKAPQSSFIKIDKLSSQVNDGRAKPMVVLHYHHSQLHIHPGTDARWLAQLMQALS